MANKRYEKRRRLVSVKDSEIFNREKSLGENHLDDFSQDETKVLSCESTWAERLASTHPDELSRKERANLVEHAQTCPICATYLADYQILSEGLRDLPNHEVCAEEPDLEFPPMIERIWQFQDEQEAIEEYKRIKDTRGRKMKKAGRLLIAGYILTGLVLIIVIRGPSITGFLATLPALVLKQIQSPNLEFMLSVLLSAVAGPIFAVVMQWAIKPLFKTKKRSSQQKRVRRMIDDGRPSDARR
jgi:hypothetical protein